MSKKRIAVFLFVSIPIIIILLVIYYIGQFFKYKSDKDEYNASKYMYGHLEITDEYVVNRYVHQISDIFESSDISQLLAIIDIEDDKYGVMGSGDLLENIQDKNILGKRLELIKYEEYKFDNIDKTYDIYVKCEDNNNIINIIIKETYPDQYTIILGF